MAAIFNPATELVQSMNTLTKLADHVTLTSKQVKGLLDSLEAEPDTDPAELGGLAAVRWAAILDAVKVSGSALSPLARSRAAVFGRFCRLRAGAEQVEPVKDTTTQAAPVATPAAVTSAASSKANVVKLREYIDQSKDVDVETLRGRRDPGGFQAIP